MKLNDSWKEARERVREAADIVQVISEHVPLRRTGANFTGLCPFHGEKTPSFSVNPQRQLYKCFGCGESGDVFSFLMKYQNLSYPDVLKELARRHQIRLPEPKLNAADQERLRLHEISQAAAQLYHDCLIKSPKAASARQYLTQRGLALSFAAKYQLGCAPDEWNFLSSQLLKQFSSDLLRKAGLIIDRREGNGSYDRFRSRIMFPIVDHRGRVCGFSGRVLDGGQPKYMNSPETAVFSKGQILFGLHQHMQAIRQSRQAVIVEGNFDLLLLAAHGISNTVAPLGTSLTKEHIHALKGCCDEAVLFFDGDSAGMKAARRAVPLFLAEGMEAKAALLPAGHDPDSFVREHGAAAAQELISNAKPLPEFIFDALTKEHGSTLAGKSRTAAELAELIKLSPNRVQRGLMAAHWAGQLGFSVDLLLPDAAHVQAMSHDAEPSLPEESGSGENPPAAAVSLSAHERQLLHFLVFYPEHFQTLTEGGLLDCIASCTQPLRETVSALRRLAAAGSFAPEQLLAVLDDSQTRRLISGLIQQGGAEMPDDEGQTRCAELMNWLRKMKDQQESAALQRQLAQAEQQGEKKLADELRLKIYKIRAKK